MKSGTTSLYAYLKEHPEIFMPAVKEPNFFCNDILWAKSVRWYESLFKSDNKKKAFGEASVGYTKHPYYKDVPKRIFSLVPNMKLIYILRSPIERIYSHYWHNVYSAIESYPLERAISENPLYIQTSLYHYQIEQYLKFFEKRNLLVILLDDLKKEPLKVAGTVFNFLSVDSSFIPPNIYEVKHQTKSKRGRDNFLMKLIRRMPAYFYLSDLLPHRLKTLSGFLLKKKLGEPEPMTEDLISKLNSALIDDVHKLSDFLDRDLSVWELKKFPSMVKNS
jgi:hypothetical protein